MYIVIEYMRDSNGNPGMLNYGPYEDENQAKAKYYTVMAAAAVSNTQIHSCVILSEEMYHIASDFVRHEI